MRLLDKEALTSLLALIWPLWNVSNDAVLKRKQTLAHVALLYAHELQSEFKVHNLIHRPLIPKVTQVVPWRLP